MNQQQVQALMLQSILVRLEGMVNRDWTLTHVDGSGERYYSIEGSAQRSSDDAAVHDYDPQLDNKLEQWSEFAADAARSVGWDEDNEVAEVLIKFAFPVEDPDGLCTLYVERLDCDGNQIWAGNA